jgi:uncharacterized protein YjbJ (UPF0337 family)
MMDRPLPAGRGVLHVAETPVRHGRCSRPKAAIGAIGDESNASERSAVESDVAMFDRLLSRPMLTTTEEDAMNWTQIEGQWHQLAGQLKSQWAKLTDDDLKNVAGKREQLIGKLQERYGVLKADADKQVDKWIAKINPGPHDKSS